MNIVKNIIGIVVGIAIIFMFANNAQALTDNAAINSITTVTGNVNPGSSTVAYVDIRNTGTSTRSYWVGISYRKTGTTNAWIDVPPRQSVSIAPGISTTVPFYWNLVTTTGTYDVWAKIWSGYDSGTNSMLAPSFGERINPSAFTIVTPLTSNAVVDSFTHTTGNVNPGAAGSASVTIRNTGTSTRSYWVSLGYRTGTNGWTLIPSVQSASLAPGGSANVQFSFTLPAATGTYDIRAIITDTSSTSSTQFGVPRIDPLAFTVVAAPVDNAALISFTHTTGNVNLGSSGSATITLRNSGTSTRAFWVGLSYRIIGTSAWIDVPTRQSAVIAPGISTPVSFTFIMPNVAGNYEMWTRIASGTTAIADPTFAQQIDSSPPAFTLVAPTTTNNAVIDSFTHTTGNVNPGAAGSASVTIRNTGTSTRSYWVSLGYRTGTNGWTLIPSVQSASLAPGGSANVQFSFTLPTATGTYDIRAIITDTSSTSSTQFGVPRIDPLAFTVVAAPVAPSIAEGVDATTFTWTTGGNANWVGETTTSYYGGDAAQSGRILDSQNTWVQTSVTGPGTLGFYWKVSSEPSWDFLEFLIDGAVQTGGISGGVNWQQKSYNIAAGTHTLQWKYRKDGSVSAGSDAGWVDSVSFTLAMTTPTPTPTTNPITTLGEAVDATALTWTTGGNTNWLGEITTSYYGNDAAQSGLITHSQNTWIQSSTPAPGGTLRFYWKVSSESNFDFLEFFIDGVLQAGISGMVDWQQKTYIIPAGSHQIQWKYRKDGSVNAGSDAGWVDFVSFDLSSTTPTPTSTPTRTPTSTPTPTPTTTPPSQILTNNIIYSEGSIGGSLEQGNYIFYKVWLNKNNILNLALDNMGYDMYLYNPLQAQVVASVGNIQHSIVFDTALNNGYYYIKIVNSNAQSNAAYRLNVDVNLPPDQNVIEAPLQLLGTYTLDTSFPYPPLSYPITGGNIGEVSVKGSPSKTEITIELGAPFIIGTTGTRPYTVQLPLNFNTNGGSEIILSYDEKIAMQLDSVVFYDGNGNQVYPSGPLVTFLSDVIQDVILSKVEWIVGSSLPPSSILALLLPEKTHNLLVPDVISDDRNHDTSTVLLAQNGGNGYVKKIVVTYDKSIDGTPTDNLLHLYVKANTYGIDEGFVNDRNNYIGTKYIEIPLVN